MATVTNTRTDSTGMGPKKTLIVMVTVVGCIAILWPKVFYPMMAGNQQPKNNAIKDHRTGGCCDVVLDQDELLANESANFLSHHAFRKTVHQLTEEQSIRQERPPLLRTEPMHPAMRERGRTIPPNTQSVPILERGHPPVPPKVVEGRPIPGMRPPMGAGSYQAPKQSATSMSFIMPLYTIGIVSFFIYTIMKLVMKKPQRAPYENVTPDPAFRNEVFTPEVVPQIKRPDDGTTKLVVTAIEGLISAADEQLIKIEKDRKQKIVDPTSSEAQNLVNLSKESSNESLVTANGHMKSTDESHTNNVEKMVHRKRDTSADRGTIKVMGMEMTASHESSPRKRPVTPTLMLSSKFEPPTIEDDTPKAQEIYLQGSLPHESKILVSDSETAVEDAVQLDDEDYDQDEAPVILSGKMTLSLINMDHMEKEALVGDIEIEKEPFEDAEEYRQDKLGDEQHTVNEE